MFKINGGYKLELQTPETVKLFETTKNAIDKIKNGKNLQRLELAEVVLVQCNLGDNKY